MSRNICQAFLRDSIANELDVRFKPAALGRDVLDDRDPGRLRELAAQRIERAVQAEVFQRIGTQPRAMPRTSSRLARTVSCASSVRRESTPAHDRPHV